MRTHTHSQLSIFCADTFIHMLIFNTNEIFLSSPTDVAIRSSVKSEVKHVTGKP